MFAVRFKAKEARAFDNSILTKEGQDHWVVVDREGWVPASSVSIYNNYSDPPRDAKLFKDVFDAHAFMADWGGHPWYSIPKSWEVLTVTPRFSPTPIGYSVVE